MSGRLAGWFTIAWVISAGNLSAQTNPTPAPAAHPCDDRAGATKAVCRASYDAISIMTPLAALAASGGNPSVGTAAGGERSGQVWFSLRGTYLQTILPDTRYDGSVDTVQAVRRFPAAVPRLDIRVTLLNRALPVGTASVDFLGSVLGVPSGATDDIRLTPDTRSLAGIGLGFGYGIRIGMAPKGPLPVASLNVTRHDLPRFRLGDLVDGSNFTYALSASAMNVRLLAGRRFGAIEFTAGGGADLIKGDYSLVYVDQTTKKAVSQPDSTVSTMRLLTVSNLALYFGKGARLSFEGGFQIGKNDKLPTRFEAINTKSGRFFGGVALGFKL